MNTNPDAKVILCYGDSNTWGRNPKGKGIRFPVNIRWTGVPQTELTHILLTAPPIINESVSKA